MNEKLRNMRISAKLTQEQLAEKMNISRQSVAKWENGESIPDVLKCTELAKILGFELEDIASAFKDDDQIEHPKNKYMFGVTKIVNNKIELPEETLRVFDLKNGDDLVVLGDTTQGIALTKKKDYEQFLSQIVNFPVLGGDNDENGN